MNVRFLFLLLIGLLLAGCTITPHANVGLSLRYSDGHLKLRPEANIGVYGRP